MKVYQAGYPYVVAVSWLTNTPASSVDSLARKILALQPAGVNLNPALQQLLLWRNVRLAWGAYDRYETSFPDTPLALAALRTVGYPYAVGDLTATLCVVVLAQNTGAATVDGSWSFIRAGSTPPPSAVASAILPTVHNLLELRATQAARGWTGVTCNGAPYTFSTATDRAITWLLAQRRQADGGFGDRGISTVFETALAYLALSTVRPADPATGSALDYLIARQQTDGSWNGDPFQTALVLKILPPPPAPLVDTDNDGIPDAVESVLGTDPNVADSRWLARGSGTDGPSGPSMVAGPRTALSAGTGTAALAMAVTGARGARVVQGPAAADGDLNGDGIVDAADVALAERIALRRMAPTIDQLARGDVTGDGVIDVADVARLRRMALGLDDF